MLKKITHVLLHSVLYYLSWFGTLLSVRAGHPWLGLALTLSCVALQCAWQHWVMRQSRKLWLLLLLFLIAGFMVDSSLLQLKWIDFAGNPWAGIVAPPWMQGLWLAFAILFYALLGSLFRRYFIVGVLAFFGYPIAYYSGILLHAASSQHLTVLMLSLGISWAVLLPLLLFCFNYVCQEKNHA